MHRVFIIIKLALVALFALNATAFAQISDPRVGQLEEQVRQLTGQVEELNFQMLQMQEDNRKQREDLEFRLQELENKQGSLTNNDAPATDVAEATISTPVSPDADVVASAQPAPSLSTQPRLGSQAAGSPPRDLGSMVLDQNGNVVDSAVDFSEQNVGRSIDTSKVASVSGEQNPEELYQTGYAYVLSGDYSLAENVFSTFVDTYPNDPLAADAWFWLGESQLGEGRFEDAADTFIALRSQYPDAKKAPETMLKIGTIMAALGNREVACITFEDALKSQMDMSDVLRNRIGQERVNAKC